MPAKTSRFAAAIAILGASVGVAAAKADEPRPQRQEAQPASPGAQQFKVEIEGVTQGAVRQPEARQYKLESPAARQLKIDGIDGEASQQIKIDGVEGDSEPRPQSRDRRRPQ
ncbi:MAG: hypothetical protein KIS81_10355 [Maricaulaceae bacterium]|nr:hypothetical protein [Maricaulaceae bacterium]